MTGNTSPEGSRRKAHTKRTNELAKAKRERDALISGREYSTSGMSRVSPSPAPQPERAPPPYSSEKEPNPPVYDAEPQQALLRLTVLATGGAVDRTLKFEAECNQTLAELCVQAHPALVMTGQPICFKVICGNSTWSSISDGPSTLAQLGIVDGTIIQVDAQPPAPVTPQRPASEPLPESKEELITTPVMAELPPSPHVQETPLPPPIESPLRIQNTSTPVTPGGITRPSLPRNKRDTINLRVIAKERKGGGPTRIYEWELPPGEKLVALCKKCNLTEPHVPARNTNYRGFVVTSEHGDVWCTKQHGRLSIRELKLESGDEITIEMDWASLGIKKTEKKPKKDDAPSQHAQPVLIESPEEPVPAPAQNVSLSRQSRVRVRAPPPPQEPAPVPRAKKHPVAVSPTADYHEKTGIPAPPVISTDRSQSPCRIERDPLSPSPVAVLPIPAPVPPILPPPEASTLSPSRAPLAPFVPAVLPPRQTKGIPEDTAWLSFVEALSSVLHEQDLLLVSAETVRDLIRHYGFDKDPITAAKIELHWKRLSGKAPMEDKSHQKVASPTQDPRHVRHIETVFPEGRKPEQPSMSDEAARRLERGQKRRQMIAEQEEVRASRPYSSLPFGGGSGETPICGPVGRKLEQEPSVGRRRALSPPAPPQEASDRKLQLQHYKSGTCNPNNIVDGQCPDDAFAMYSKELRSIEYSENKQKQTLLTPGKKQQVRNKNVVSSEDYSIAGIGNEPLRPASGKARVVTKEDSASGCDPNPCKGGEESLKRGRNFRCGPDKAPANSDPNAAGAGEQGGKQPAKSYSVGPERLAGGCNPNSAGAHETGTNGHQRKGGISTTRMYEPAATCNPNNYNQEGDRRHAEAERAARLEGDKYFRQENRSSAQCDPNNVGEREPKCKLTRKGPAEFGRPDSGKGCDPNSLTAAGSDSVHLQGPAGSAGVFSPGLVQTGKRVGAGQPPATANPNNTLSEPASHIISHSSHPISGVPTASRKQGIQTSVQSPCDPNCVPSTMTQSPRAGGRRRVFNHPAALDNNIGALM